MDKLYIGVWLCGAVAIGSGLLCLMGQAIKKKNRSKKSGS